MSATILEKFLIQVIFSAVAYLPSLRLATATTTTAILPVKSLFCPTTTVLPSCAVTSVAIVTLFDKFAKMCQL